MPTYLELRRKAYQSCPALMLLLHLICVFLHNVFNTVCLHNVSLKGTNARKCDDDDVKGRLSLSCHLIYWISPSTGHQWEAGVVYYFLS